MGVGYAGDIRVLAILMQKNILVRNLRFGRLLKSLAFAKFDKIEAVSQFSKAKNCSLNEKWGTSAWCTRSYNKYINGEHSLK